MFTGLIEDIGTIRSIIHGEKEARIEIASKIIRDETRKGDSIAVNGVCLTVTDLTPLGFKADIMEETLVRSTFGLSGSFRTSGGKKVNLERAMLASSRFAGHMVSGHIDGTGVIRSIREMGIARIISVACDARQLQYIVEKGSVALDGVSLTVCSVDSISFSVSIIPHTGRATTLGEMHRGDSLNIECDMFAKYCEKKNSQQIDIEFLRAHGFIEGV